MSPSFAIGPLLIIAFILIGLVFGVTMWITGGRSRNKGEMACGGCGYAVRGLEALNCPECGADLRMVGIKPLPGKGSLGLGIVFAMLLTLLLVITLGSWLFMANVKSTSPAGSSPQPSQSVQQTMTNQPTPQPGLIDGTGPEGLDDDTPAPLDQPEPNQPAP